MATIDGGDCSTRSNVFARYRAGSSCAVRYTSHRAGEVAPMSLLTYEEVRPWARAIKEKVLLRQMPPWFADPKYSVFSNDPTLTPNEIDNYEMRSSYIVDQDIEMISLFPHMHLRGKDMNMTATYPGGRRETLLNVPAYNFDWQLSYYPKAQTRL